MNDDWLHKVRNRMADYEIDEPDGLWARIEGHAQKPVVSPNAFVVRLKRCAAVAAMLVAIFTVGIFYYDSGGADTADNAVTEKYEGVLDQKAVAVACLPKQENIVPSQMVAAAVVSTVESHKSVEIIKDSSIVDSTEDRSESMADTVDLKVLTPADFRGSKSNRIDYEAKADGRRNSSKIDVSLFTSGSTGVMNRSLFLMTGSDLSNSVNDANWADAPGLGMLVYNKGKHVCYEAKHRTPIRVGVSFAYSVSSRVSVISGLSYTNLTSDIRDGSDTYYYTAEQRLHYIGVPLKIKFRAFSWKKIELYSSVGFLVEKCVSANINKQYYINNMENGISRETLAKPWQLSANASIGLQCNITDKISVYAEPGVSYYFDDGTSLDTVYKDKPTNFNMDFGIRISFGAR